MAGAPSANIIYDAEIYKGIEKFKNKSEEELDEIIDNYKSKNIFYKSFATIFPLADCHIDYQAAQAVKNMNYLGLRRLINILSENISSVSHVLNELNERAKQKRKKDNLENKFYKEKK